MCAKIKAPKATKVKTPRMKREKVKDEVKGDELKPFTISCHRHNAMGYINIAECKNFKIYLCSYIGDENPEYWTRMHVQNVDIISYNKHFVRERVVEVIELAPGMSIPSECWGTDVPDDVRKFLKDSISEFIVKLPKIINQWSISANEDRYGIPVTKLSELQAKIVGICMARKKKSRKAGVSRKERKIEEEATEE